MPIFCFSNSLSDKTTDAVCSRGDVVNMLEIEKSIGIETSLYHDRIRASYASDRLCLKDQLISELKECA